ncbi:hypothetical protein FPV67DRAFT_1448779 [Lyophyllum atratum]|nr:hypothetical protein FPV67DRAFT_1448779 [Lyophyllum atratum]
MEVERQLQSADPWSMAIGVHSRACCQVAAQARLKHTHVRSMDPRKPQTEYELYLVLGSSVDLCTGLIETSTGRVPISAELGKDFDGFGLRMATGCAEERAVSRRPPSDLTRTSEVQVDGGRVNGARSILLHVDQNYCDRFLRALDRGQYLLDTFALLAPSESPTRRPSQLLTSSMHDDEPELDLQLLSNAGFLVKVTQSHRTYLIDLIDDCFSRSEKIPSADVHCSGACVEISESSHYAHVETPDPENDNKGTKPSS